MSSEILLFQSHSTAKFLKFGPTWKKLADMAWTQKILKHRVKKNVPFERKISLSYSKEYSAK